MSILQAGVSRNIITPPPGISLMGYGNRVQGNIGVHDDVYVTTLVLSDGANRAALLTVDHTFINIRIVKEIQSRIQANSGIPGEAIFVCCSHTHAGPIGYADEKSSLTDQDYIQFLINTLVESAVEANNKVQPATLLAGTDAAIININRRERTADGKIIIGNNPEGVVDHSVQVLRVANVQNETLATLVNYACHPVVMGPLNRMVSADWVGAMRRKVEADYEGYCLFFQGTTADVNPRKMRWAVDSWDEVDEQGEAVADAVIRASNASTTIQAGAITAHQSTEWLKLLPSSGYSEQIRSFLPPGLNDDEIRQAIHKGFPWHTELEHRNDGNIYSPLQIGSLLVGDWALATLGTEPFTETGLKIKAGSPAKMTFVAGYSNDCNSYLPVESAYIEGGYEVETAPLFYGLPAPFAPGGAEQVTAAILKMLQG